MVRIAFIHNYFPAGGAERVTIDIAGYLSLLQGYEVYVYASRISEPLLECADRNTFTLRQIPTQAIPVIRARQIEKFIVEDKIDIVVQVSKAIPGIEGIMSRTGVKTVVACHGEPFWQRYAVLYRRQKGAIRKLMWAIYNKRRYQDGTLAKRKAVEYTLRDYNCCNAYTVLCDPYKRQLEDSLKISPKRSHIYTIENSELPVEDVNYDKEKILLYVGRFENWSKRIDRLLRIWQRVQDKMPDWRLVLVGDGADWKSLKFMSEAMDLKRVSFEGQSTDVGSYYKKASVVVMTSETEGWPLSLTEAQAQGCVCVAFGCTSGVEEVLSPDGGCGFVVTPFDEVEYEQTLLRIAEMSDEEMMDIRRNAVAKRLNYVPEIISEKWRQLFDRLCTEQ